MRDTKLMGKVIAETLQEHNIDAKVRRVNGIWTVEMHNEKSQFIYALKGDDYFCERIYEKLAMYDSR